MDTPDPAPGQTQQIPIEYDANDVIDSLTMRNAALTKENAILSSALQKALKPKEGTDT